MHASCEGAMNGVRATVSRTTPDGRVNAAGNSLHERCTPRRQRRRTRNQCGNRSLLILRRSSAVPMSHGDTASFAFARALLVTARQHRRGRGGLRHLRHLRYLRYLRYLRGLRYLRYLRYLRGLRARDQCGNHSRVTIQARAQRTLRLLR